MTDYWKNIGADPFSRWGPSSAERAQQRREALDDDEVWALETDLVLMRHGSSEALRRVVEFINRAEQRR